LAAVRTEAYIGLQNQAEKGNMLWALVRKT
jgi:hypothetical protein